MNMTQPSAVEPSAILAVDAGGTVLKAALVDRQGRLIAGSAYRLPVDSAGDRASVEETYIQLARRGLEEARSRGLILAGIGVSIPGPFDYEQGLCLMTHKYQSIYKVPMRPWFEAGAGPVPVRFVHDSTAFMLGAVWQGPYEGYRRIGAVIIGTGLGFATLLDGQVFKNPQGGPGISIYARPYRAGTAEDYVSRRGITGRFRQLRPDTFNGSSGPDVREIAELARQGDRPALRVFRDTGLFLAEILHDILRDTRFEVLLLGGQIAKSADLFLPELKSGLEDLEHLAIIEQARDIDDAPLVGVARACWQAV